MTRPAILFYCQHSLGMGHLVRSLAIAEGLANRFHVMLLNGGRQPKGVPIPPGIQIVNLPPLGIDETNQLVSQDKRLTVKRALERRTKMMLTCFDNLRPAAVLLELFPFGRKRFAVELEPLLNAARSEDTRALVVCCLRDILGNRGENQEHYDNCAATLANKFLDLILVHSDPSFARFEESFHATMPLAVPVLHTGFVVPQSTTSETVEGGRKRIVVSAGSGTAAEGLLRTAMEAHDHFADDPEIEMKIVAGPFFREEYWRELRTLARGKPQLSLVRQVANLGDELRGAAASISQAGYNTCLDVLRTGVPALLIPVSGTSEDEQRRRAFRLRDLGAVRVLEEKDRSPLRLAAEIRELMNFEPAPSKLDLNGAQRSLQIIETRISSTTQAKAIAYHSNYEN